MKNTNALFGAIIYAVIVGLAVNGCERKSVKKEHKRGWSKVEQEQFTIQIPSYWQNGSLFAENWSSLAVNIAGSKLLAVHFPSDSLKNTNFGGLQLTVGKSSAQNAGLNCLSPLPNRARTERRDTTINDIPFTVIRAKDAATGDRYVTTSYRVKHNGACWAIETVLNYSPITFYGKERKISKFDRSKIADQIQAVIHTFEFK